MTKRECFANLSELAFSAGSSLFAPRTLRKSRPPQPTRTTFDRENGSGHAGYHAMIAERSATLRYDRGAISDFPTPQAVGDLKPSLLSVVVPGTIPRRWGGAYGALPFAKSWDL